MASWRAPWHAEHRGAMALSLATPGDLLAALPSLLGAQPRESLVAVGIGPRGEVSPVIRVDLDVCAVREACEALAVQISGLMARSGATYVVVAGLSDYPERAARAVARARAALSERCDVADAWVVSGGRYWSPECADTGCCPEGGRQLPPPPLDGPRRYARAPHAQMPSAPASRRKRARAAYQRALASARRGDGAVWRLAVLAEWRSVVSAAATGQMPTDAASGRLIAALSDVIVRDAVVVDLVPGEERVAEALCRGEEADGVREALSRMIGTEHPQSPPDARLAAVVAIAEHCAWLLPVASAPSHTLVGLCRWWRADDEAAAAAIGAALQRDPGYRLAELLACALEMGMQAGWKRAS